MPRPLPYLAAIAAAGAISLGACAAERDPADTWLAWLNHLRAGEMEAAWELLSAASQAELAALEAGSSLPETEPADPDRPGFRIFVLRSAPTELGGAAPVPKNPESFILGTERRGLRARLSLRDPAPPEGADPEAAQLSADLIYEAGGWRIMLKCWS